MKWLSGVEGDTSVLYLPGKNTMTWGFRVMYCGLIIIYGERDNPKKERKMINRLQRRVAYIHIPKKKRKTPKRPTTS